MNQAYEFRLPLLNDLQPIWDFGITGAITGPVRSDSVRSPTYTAIEFTPQADHGVSFNLNCAANSRPRSDLVIRFEKDLAPSRLCAASRPKRFRFPPRRPTRPRANPIPGRGGATYFMATIPPSDELLAKHDAVPADILILADTSAGTLRASGGPPAPRCALSCATARH